MDVKGLLHPHQATTEVVVDHREVIELVPVEVQPEDEMEAQRQAGRHQSYEGEPDGREHST